LGVYTGTGELYQDICNSTFIGSFHWFAANGDEIYGSFEGYLTPTGTPGVYDNHETADVTGGTGRFTSATGHWESGGQVDFTTEPISFVTPRKGGSRLSARTGSRGCAPDLCIATRVRLVAMR